MTEEYEYDLELQQQLELEEMRKHCPGCFYWDDYYLCLTGDCIYEIV